MILESIPDPRQRAQIAAILQGTIVKQVYCMSSECKGRHIADLYKDGVWRIVPSGKDEQGRDLYWLRSWRNRLDGFPGFECWCGNDSRLAKQEVGEVGQGVTKQGIENVAIRLQQDPASYPTIKGEQEIDGFVLKDVG